MTGYQSPPTLNDAIAQHSSIGGLIYSFLGPTLENLAKEKLGIDLSATIYDPRTRFSQRVSDMFGSADLSESYDSVNAVQWATSITGNNPINLLAGLVKRGASGTNKIAPILQQTLLSTGVRGAWHSPGKTLLEVSQDSLSNKITQNDIYQAFSDSLINSIPGIDAGEKAELASNYIKSNINSIAGYKSGRSVFVEDFNALFAEEFNGLGGRKALAMRLDDGGYSLSQAAVKATRNLINDINKHDSTFTLSDGKVNIDGITDDALKEKLQKLNRIIDGSDGAATLSTGSDGKIAAKLDGVIDTISKTQKNIKEYSKAIQAWGSSLNTSLEGANAQLNNIAGMDISATFKGNYKTLRQIAQEGDHINAITGKGSAFTQSSVHAASNVINAYGGDAAASFLVGHRAALMHNQFGGKYRVDDSQLDLYNVRMTVGYQEAETSKLYSAAFAAGGFDNTEEGRDEFWGAVRRAGITNKNVSRNRLLAMVNRRRKRNKQRRISLSDFDGYSLTGTAKDFLSVDTEHLDRNEESMADTMSDFIADASNISKDAKAAIKNVLENGTDQQKRQFWSAIGSNKEDGTAMLKGLGISGDNIHTDINSALEHEAKRTDITGNKTAIGHLAGGKGVQFLANHMAGVFQKRITQKEVAARTQAQEWLMDRWGSSPNMRVALATALGSASEADGDNIRNIVTGLFTNGGYSPDTLKLIQDYTKDSNPHVFNTNLKGYLEKQEKIDKAFETETGMSAKAARERLMTNIGTHVKDGTFNAETKKTYSRMLSRLYGGRVSLNDEGKIVQLDISAYDHRDNDATKKEFSEIAKQAEKDPYMSDEIREKFWVQNNAQVQTQGSQQEIELATARTAAYKSYQRASQRVTKSDKDKSERDADLAKHKEQLKNLGVYLDDKGKVLSVTDDDKFLEKKDNVKILDRFKRQNSQEMKSAAEHAGVSPITGIEGVVRAIYQLLKNNIKQPGGNGGSGGVNIPVFTSFHNPAQM